VPLNADNVIRVGRGSAATSSTSTAIVVTLDASGTTDADSVVFVGLFGEGLTFATPSGWAVVGTPANGLSVYRRGPVEGLAAGESSWNFTPSATAGKAVTAGALELTGVDPNLTVDIASVVDLRTTGNSFGAHSGLASTYSGLLVEFLCHRDSANATPVTFGSYVAVRGNQAISSTEAVLQNQAGTGNSVVMAACVATAPSPADYSVGTTPSRTPLSTTAPGVSIAIVINEIGAKKASDLFYIDGHEQGTLTGATAATTPLTTGVSLWRPWQTLAAGVSLSGAAARSGSYGMAFNSTAAVCNAITPEFEVDKTGDYPTFRVAFDLDGDLTARRLMAVTAVSSIGSTVTATVSLRSDGYLGLTVASGTEVVSDQQPPSSGWFAVEVRHDTRAKPNYVTDWWIDYDAELADDTPAVAQTSATGTSSNITTLLLFRLSLGWSVAATARMYADDVGGAVGQNAPIGDLRVIPLKVDAAGTVTVTTSTNFGQTVNNGTNVTAFNAATFRDCAREMPPVLTASRKVALAIAASATDHAKIPMETYDLAANQVAVRGVVLIGVIFAASATATTLRLLVFDGTTSYTVYPEADPDADATATPKWIKRVVRGASAPILWSQPAIDALQVWMASNDANPDVGGSFMLELAVVKARPEVLFGEAGEPIYVEAHRDPVTQALIGATVNNNSGASVELTWEVDGVPASSGSIPDGTAGLYVPISADGGIETVGTVSLIPG
jgi:hypothetical protein